MYRRSLSTLLSLVGLLTADSSALAAAPAQVIPPAYATGRPTQLVCGEIEQGVVQQPAATVPFFFQGVAGQTVDLVMNEVAGFVDSFAEANVTSPSGEPLGVLIGTEFETFVLPEKGFFRVDVGASAQGSFTLSLGCLGGSTPMQCGTLISTSLDAAGELDYFVFDGQTGDLVQLSLAKAMGFASSVPRGTLLSPSGEQLGTFDADNVTPFLLPEDGTYLVRLRANDLAGTGSYNLGLGCVPPVNAMPLFCGDSVGGATEDPGELTYFTFDGGVDAVVEIAIVSDTATFVPQVRIFDPLGDLVATFTSDSLQPLALEGDGLFTIEVRAATLGDTGPFTLSLACRDPLGPATDLACGGMASEALGIAEVDYYTFTGTAGDVAQITLAASAGFTPPAAPQMRIFTPSGGDLGSFTADSVNPITLPEDGMYAVRVTSNTLIGTGTYDIALDCLPPSGVIHVGNDSLTTETINAAAETDLFSFDGEMGELVELVLVQTAGFAGTVARGTLFSPSGTNLGMFDANSLTEFTLPETGSAGTGNPYTVEVRAANLVGTGSYSLGLERRPVASGLVNQDPQYPPLACRQVISQSIGAAGEVDYFRFEGSAGDVVDVTLVVTSGFPGSVPCGTVFSPTGLLVSSFCANTINEITLPDSGQYSIRVNTNTLFHTGTYNIGLSCRAPLGPVVSRLVCGDVAQGAISEPAEVLYYTFEGQMDDVVEFTLVATSGFAGSTPCGYVYSSSGILVDSFCANSINEITLPESGQYSVRILTNTLFHTGTFNLGLSCRQPLGPVEDNLECGDVLSGSISIPAEVVYYTFGGEMDDVVEVTLVATGGFPGSIPVGTVYSPSGTLVDSFSANSINELTLPESGQYAVRILTNTLFHTGDFNLGLSCRDPLGPVVDNLECGDVLSGSISVPAEVIYYTFDGQMDDVVEATLVATSGFPGSIPVGTVYSPSGILVDSFNANSINEITLPESGQYAVRILTNTLFHTGTFNLGLSCRQPLGPVVDNLECGDVLSGSISVPAEVIYYTFDGQMNDVVDVTLVATSGFPGSTPRGFVYSPSGTLVDSFNANSINEMTLPDSGQYAVRIIANTLFHTGTFNLGLSCRQPLGPVVDNLDCGDLLSGSISGPAEVIYYTFDGQMGDAVEVTLVATSGFPGSTPCANVYSPSGLLVDSFCANSLNPMTLPESGQYSIRILTNTLFHTGDFNLGLTCLP